MMMHVVFVNEWVVVVMLDVMHVSPSQYAHILSGDMALHLNAVNKYFCGWEASA